MGTRVFFPGVKQPGREADYSLPSSAEVKEDAFMVLCSVKKAQGELYL
jgi:hypothetical protein